MEIPMESFKKTLIVLGAALAVGLAGCGGGGGDEPAPTTFDGATSGKVAKGIIQFGAVTAEELDVNGNVIRAVGTAQTDINGDYSLEIGDAYGGGVIRLTLASDGTNTQMICDVQPDCAGVVFGDPIDIASSSFSMVALLPSVDGGASVSAQITPFSHMAASRVAAGTEGFTADAVKNAISEINQLVGVDVLNISPVDITNTSVVDTASTEELVYSAFNAGVGALIFDAADVETGLQELADSFADGVFDSTDAVSIIDILAAVDEQATASGIDSLELDQVLATIEAELVDSDGDGVADTYDPEPTDSATLTAVEQAKELVGEIRTLATSIEGLESPAKAFQADLELTSSVVNENADALMEFVGLAIDAVIARIDALALSGTLALDSTFTADIVSGGVVIGQVSFVLSETATGGLAIALTVNNASGVDMDLSLVTSLPVSDVFGSQAFSLSEVTSTLTGSVENGETVIGFTNMDLAISFPNTTEFIPEQLNPLNIDTNLQPIAMSFDGEIQITDVATNASFTGTTTIELVELDVNYADDPTDPNPMSLSEISLNGVFADASNSFTAAVGLSVNNAATFDTIALLEHEPSLWVSGSEIGDTFGFVGYAGGLTLQWGYYDPYSNETCISTTEAGYQCVAGDVLATHDYFVDLYSDALSVEVGVWYEATFDTTWYEGYVEFGDFETAANYVKATLTATLALALEGYPETTAVVTVDRTALDGGSALVTLTSGNSVTFNLVKPDDGSASTLTVSNPDGVAMVVSGLAEDQPISGDVTVDGTNVGSVEETDLGLVLLRYADGTFETLF